MFHPSWSGDKLPRASGADAHRGPRDVRILENDSVRRMSVPVGGLSRLEILQDHTAGIRLVHDGVVVFISPRIAGANDVPFGVRRRGKRNGCAEFLGRREGCREIESSGVGGAVDIVGDGVIGIGRAAQQSVAARGVTWID